MKKKTLFVAITTQKGGIGKTSVTVLLSSYLHYLKGYEVAVVDCDYPQYSIFDLRNRETEVVASDEYYSVKAYNQLCKIEKKCYSIIMSSIGDATSKANELAQEENLDIVFFDMPGTLNTDGVLDLLSEMDYIFSPISADRLVVESTLQFLSLFNDNLITTGIAKAKGVNLFWTMVDGREKTSLYDMYNSVINDLGQKIMKTSLPDSKRYRREITFDKKPIFRSTFFPIDSSMLKSSRIPELAEEICSIINLKN